MTDLDLLDGAPAIYPGHPLTLAWFIVNVYPSLAAATQKSARSEYSEALTNASIPGAGGNVHAALDFLRRVIAEQTSIEDAIDLANTVWARCDGQSGDARLVERFRRGQEQAACIVDKLRQKLKSWR